MIQCISNYDQALNSGIYCLLGSKDGCHTTIITLSDSKIRTKFKTYRVEKYQGNYRSGVK